MSTVILRSVGKKFINQPWLLGVSIAIIYQIVLVNGLEEYILKGSKGIDSREGFVDANREGIFSSIGYLAIYLIGVSIGKLIFHNK